MVWLCPVLYSASDCAVRRQFGESDGIRFVKLCCLSCQCPGPAKTQATSFRNGRFRRICRADPLVRTGRPRPAAASTTSISSGREQADGGVGRGPCGSPHNLRRGARLGKLSGIGFPAFLPGPIGGSAGSTTTFESGRHCRSAHAGDHLRPGPIGEPCRARATSKRLGWSPTAYA
jgi:hypothetical protein